MQVLKACYGAPKVCFRALATPTHALGAKMQNKALQRATKFEGRCTEGQNMNIVIMLKTRS